MSSPLTTLLATVAGLILTLLAALACGMGLCGAADVSPAATWETRPPESVGLNAAKLVMAWNDAKIRSRDAENTALKLLAEACAIRTNTRAKGGMFFPPPGEAMTYQARRQPAEVGLNPEIISALKSHASKGRWALWRDGFLAHVEGNFNQTQDVASLRKTWHALTVGAAIKQGKIPSYSQKISVWNKELTGLHAEATWWHVITQTSGFDGVVFAGAGMDTGPTTHGIPHVIEWSIAGPNPLVQTSESPVAADVRRLTTKSEIRNLKSEIEVSLLTSAATKARSLGPFPKWQCIEIILHGPPSQGRGETNPFSVFVDATFTAPSGRIFKMPGFYDGDGQGGLDGNDWKVRFSADETGQWTFATTSTNALVSGVRGTFVVTAASPDAPGFYRWGRLQAVGTAQNRIRYLKFRDGPYWLKAGCDDPETRTTNCRRRLPSCRC